MRITFLILIIKLLCSCTSKQVDNKLYGFNLEFKNIDSLNSLSVLFNNSSIKDNQIIWSLNYEDIYDFSNNLSSDSLCHTIIDTILNSNQIYYVILRTDQYEKNQKADCHVCSPIVSIAKFMKIKSGFKLINFKKNVFQIGGYGEYGTISIDTLCSPILHVSSGWMGTGAIIDYDNYYDINDFSFIYGLTTFSSNGGDYNTNEANYEEIKKTVINKTDSSFVVETIILKNDSLSKPITYKYFERITLFNDNGALEIKTNRLNK